MENKILPILERRNSGTKWRKYKNTLNGTNDLGDWDVAAENYEPLK